MRWLARCLALVILACAVFAGALAYGMFADRSHPAATADVVIPSGATFHDALSILQTDGVVANTFPLHVLARVRGEERSVRAGEYRFAAHRTAAEVLQALVTQGSEVARWVTFPEGFTDAQIAQRLQSAGFGSARTFARAFATTSIQIDGSKTKSLEGFLFPDTYLIPDGATPSEVERQLERAFEASLPPDAARRARALRMTIPAIVTIASLVEREAKVEADRPLIAGVIYRRLQLGMPLQVDATIEYVLPHHETELTRRDLAIASPYNTYLHAGLPPTPIANPGAASIDAAFHPTLTGALYYVYCGGGRHVFAETLAQHQANVARCLK